MRLTGLLGGLAAILVVLSPGQALAAHVRCGDVVAQDTRLDSDLLDCPGDGVVIGADGITLDLGGHTIDGSGLGDGNQGVDNSAGHDDVTIETGTIREFQADVSLVTADRNRVRRLALGLAGYGVYLQNADANVIEQNRVSGTGILVWVGCTDNVLEGNDVSGPGTAIELHGGLASDPAQTTIGTRIERNRLTANGAGVVDVSTGQSLIARNNVTGSVEAAIVASGGLDVVTENTVSGNGTGIHVGASNVTVSRNHVRANDGDGITVAAGSATWDNVVEGNMAGGNGDDGIDLDDPDVTVTRNTANHNADLGIEAAAGVTDGGANRAHGNGNPLECLNVFCK